jgi:hypothetical protein
MAFNIKACIVHKLIMIKLANTPDESLTLTDTYMAA